MVGNFSTSTNIIRDSARDIKYIPTPNSIQIADQIIDDFKIGLRSFNVIGSYGTGKSSFLWAFQRSFNSKRKIFSGKSLDNYKVDFIDLIGEYKSIINFLKEYYHLRKTENAASDIFSKILNHYQRLGREDPLLIILIDEFGKFLEYAAQYSPETDLYFIQQFTEFVNDPRRNILLITTLHQNFDAYAQSLNTAQKNEWTKVKGRFRELAFNEPIEQLLFLASEHLNQKRRNPIITKRIDEARITSRKSNVLNLQIAYAKEVCTKLYPLELLSATVLTNSLQKYGQNERSLFSFLESTDQTGIKNFDTISNPFYNIACVYDYLVYNFYSFINSRYNPDYASWSAIKEALEHTERSFHERIEDYKRIIKTIGLLNLSIPGGADFGKTILSRYCNECLGVQGADQLIENLEEKKIILFRTYNKRFIIFGGTDLDITSALVNAESKIDEIYDIVSLVREYFTFQPVMAKKYYFETGTPRVFEFVLSDHPIQKTPEGDIDGFVNLIFNDKVDKTEIIDFSTKINKAILFGYVKGSKKVKQILYEIEKVKHVIKENYEDKVAVRELNNILNHHKELLSNLLIDHLYGHNSTVLWIFNGEAKRITNKRVFNKHLSEICYKCYPATPRFINELVNKHKISKSIHAARRNYLKALVKQWDQPDLGFDRDKFPPEKTIYLTLLRENDLDLLNVSHSNQYPIGLNASYIQLWDSSVSFINSAKKGRKKIFEFVELLSQTPFKLKQGLIDFWVPSFLFIKRDDFALFGDAGFIPHITDEILELIIKNPNNFEIKAFEIEGIRLEVFNHYRSFLNQQLKDRISNQSFIETIKPFLVFYRNLPEFTKNTNNNLSNEAKAIRSSISQAKDPEKTFFEDFPISLGLTIDNIASSQDALKQYILVLQASIKELRGCFEKLLDRFEGIILNDIIGERLSFDDYRKRLQERFNDIKVYNCPSNYRIFLMRLASQIDDRNAWFNSISNSIIGKSFENFTDEDEITLIEKFKSIIFELDSLTNLAREDVNEQNEDILGIEMTSFVDGIKKNLIRLPKSRRSEVIKLKDSIRDQLKGDVSIKVAALAELIKECIAK